MLTLALEDYEITITKSTYENFVHIIKDDIVMVGEKNIHTLPPVCQEIAPLDQFIENGRGLEIGEIPPETNIYTKPIHLDKISHDEKGYYNIPGKSSSGSYYSGDAKDYPHVCDFVFTDDMAMLDEVNKILRPGGYCILVVSAQCSNFNSLKDLLTAADFTPIYRQVASHQIIVGRKRHIAIATEIADSRRTLIVYTLHAMSENVEFFLRYGIFESPIYDFMIVVNNLNLKIQVAKYVKVIYRENKGFDFGAWGVGIFSINRQSYSHFILINNSVLGPFVNSIKPWPERFLDKLTGDVKLVGTTINSTAYGWGYMPRITPHIQSMVLAMPLETLDNLIRKGIISDKIFEADFMKLIHKCETGTSRTVLDNDGNIACLMPLFNNIDFRNPKDTDPCCHSIFSPFHISKMCINSDIVFVKSKGAKLPEIYRWTSVYNNCEIVDKIMYNDQDITQSIMYRTDSGPWSVLTNVNLYTKMPIPGKWVINEREIPTNMQTLLFTRIDGKLAYALLN